MRINNLEYTQSLSAKYHRSATVFFLSTLDLCGPFVCTAKQNKYLLILKIKQICLCIIYVATNFFFHLTDRGQPSNLTFIWVRNSTLDFHLCTARGVRFAFCVSSTCLCRLFISSIVHSDFLCIFSSYTSFTIEQAGNDVFLGSL